MDIIEMARLLMVSHGVALGVWPLQRSAPSFINPYFNWHF